MAFAGTTFNFISTSSHMTLGHMMSILLTLILRSQIQHVKTQERIQMTTSNPPQNRRERRAQAHKKSSPDTSSVPITLSQPPRAAPTQKTLLEIAAERELLNAPTVNQPNDVPSIVTTVINPDGSLSDPTEIAGISAGSVSTPYLDVVFYTINLILLHFTLTVLVHHQYASERPSIWGLILSSTVFSVAPWLILLLVFLLHPRSSDLPIQLLFAVISIGAGFWLVYATNDEPYMAVMKKAPALGTLWVWAIIELKWEWGIGCLAVVGGLGWWKGYSIF